MDLNELHPGQVKIRSEAGRFNVISCGRRFGKTVLGIDLVAEAALDGGPAGWFAPEYKLLAEAWRDLEELLGPAIRHSNAQERRIELITGGTIEAWSFDRNPKAGRSRKYKRIVIDEAAHCKSLGDVWTKAVRPTLTDLKGDAWFLSSPCGKNDFYALFSKGTAAGPWKNWKATSYDNPHLDPAEIDAARDDLGPTFFAQEYLAEFLDDACENLIPPAWIDLAVTPAARAAAKAAGKSPRWMGVDPSGGVGADRSAIVVRDANRVLEVWASAQHGLLPDARARLEPEIERRAIKWQVRPDHIVYDANGVGRNLGAYLRNYGLPGARAHFGGGAGGRRFGNLRTACAFALRARLDPAMPDRVPFAIHAGVHWDELREELVNLRTKLDAPRLDGPRESLELKTELAARLRRSPDLADALLCSFAFPNG